MSYIAIMKFFPLFAKVSFSVREGETGAEGGRGEVGGGVL